MRHSLQFETVTDDRLALDPWISWPTLHRGVNDEIHGILHLGQPLEEVDRKYPPIWTILKNKGLSVGVFGSLHSSNVPADATDYSFYVPDYFATEPFAHPPALQPFQAVNLRLTRASARNVDRSIPGSSIDVIRSIGKLGIRASTLADILGQLLREFRDSSTRIRRRTYQGLIMGDIFASQLDRSKPDFATFYTNHVAAAMHRYWGAAFPEDYSDPMEDEWIHRYSDEIDFALDKLDVMLKRILEFLNLNPAYTLVVASSMGQAAIPAHKTFEFLTITDVGRFVTALGVPEGAWESRPAMIPCHSVVVSPEFAGTLRNALETLCIGGMAGKRDKRPVGPFSFDEAQPGSFQFFVQFDNYAGPAAASLGGREIALERLGLGYMHHEDGVNCTAQHVPEGSLLVYRPGMKPRDAGMRPRVSTCDIVPSILRYFGLPRPSYLSGVASIPLFAQSEGSQPLHPSSEDGNRGDDSIRQSSPAVEHAE